MKSKKKANRKQTNKGGNPNWKKGQSGNPKGMKPRPKDELESMSLDRWRLHQIYAKLAHCTEEELEANRNDPKIDIKTKIVSGIFLRANDRDYHAWESIVSRVFGKPRESVKMEVSGKLSLVEVVRRIGDRNSR